jgi:hypothetical protein
MLARLSQRKSSLCNRTTTAPMGFVRQILARPANERPFVLLPVGYPAADAVVPELRRKALEDVAIFIEGDLSA